jgi:hypothetical protein
MVSVVVGQLIGIPPAVAATIGVVEGLLLTGLVSVVAERVLFRMPSD